MMHLKVLSLCLIPTMLFASLNGSAKSMNSWVESANDPTTDFPVQNLPYGIFKKHNDPFPLRIGVAIGDFVFDVRTALEEGLFDNLSEEAKFVLMANTLNPLMALDKQQLKAIRHAIMNLLKEDSELVRDNFRLRQKLLIPIAQAELLLPVQIGDYTDFYTSIQHAMHVGSIMRPENPLTPNYKHMPIGYHGRSSSIIISGTPVQRPSGQILNADSAPSYNLSRNLDFELEMGAFIGRGNALGHPIAIDEAKEHIFGFVLLNDWSARDVQKWEYQPLGPFNGKNFATTISPWVVTYEALEPYQIEAKQHPEGDPAILDYLSAESPVTFNIEVEAYISSANMRKDSIPPYLICKGNVRELYWTFDQMLTQHTSSGCNLRTGDLLGSGTISGESSDSLGCLLERIGCKHPLKLPDGTDRIFLMDGDEITLRAYAIKEGCPRIGFGQCSGHVFNTKNEK